MKVYFFNNSYLNGIANGIQAGHALNRMWPKYLGIQDCSQLKMLVEFSLYWETWIVLNGGMMESKIPFFDTVENPYPWEIFTEPGLNNTLTSIAIIIPQRLYDTDPPQVREELEINPYTQWELEFLQYKSTCTLAR